MISDFIHAAMPWILMGLAVAIFAVGAVRRKGLTTLLTQEEQVLFRKRQNERLSLSMALGMLAGIAVGCTPLLDLSAGVACGALVGIGVGYYLVRGAQESVKVKNIVFDLGGVIVNTDDQAAYDKLYGLGCRLPDNPEALAQSERKIVALVNGEINLAQYVSYLRQYMPDGVSNAVIGEAVMASLQGAPKARVEWIKGLKSRYHVVLLSNIGPEIWQRAVSQLNDAGVKPEDLFDEMFLSYEMGVAKPDPEIYARMIAETGIVTSQTIYFDDKAENVAAGNAAGMHSIKVRENHIEELEICSLL